MKRLSVCLAGLVLVAGCATGPQGRGPQPGAASGQPAPGAQGQPMGQTQPLPSQAPPTSQSQGQPPGMNNGGASNSGAGSNQNAGAPRPKAPPSSPAEVSSPAVMSLLNRADTLANGGHMDDAAATLERALDLDPRNPFIYQRLSAVRLAQGQAGQAEQLAMKSNSVAGNNPFVESGNWQLIAEARKSTGDSRGASAARSQAVNFQQSASQYDQ